MVSFSITFQNRWKWDNEIENVNAVKWEQKKQFFSSSKCNYDWMQLCIWRDKNNLAMPLNIPKLKGKRANERQMDIPIFGEFIEWKKIPLLRLPAYRNCYMWMEIEYLIPSPEWNEPKTYIRRIFSKNGMHQTLNTISSENRISKIRLAQKFFTNG